MKHWLAVFFLALLSGCFKTETPLPQVKGKQNIDIATDSLVCFSGYEDFESFQVFCSRPYSDIAWFRLVGIGVPYWIFISEDDTIYFPNQALTGYTLRAEMTTSAGAESHNVHIVYCANQLYVPSTFTPDGDGTNDTWFPVYYNTQESEGSSYTIQWEVRTLNGLVVFNSSELGHSGNGWDGHYDEHRMPAGTYLYHIEITVSGKKPLYYTGAFDLIR